MTLFLLTQWNYEELKITLPVRRLRAKHLDVRPENGVDEEVGPEKTF